MKLPRRAIKRGRVEIIPMIDTILILLIFYMSFSTFTQKEKRMDAKMPLLNPNPKPPTEIELDIILHVFNKDQVVVNGAATYDMASLRSAMETMAAIGQKATVVIEAEPTTAFQDIISALDACAQANMTKVAFRPLQTTGAPTP
jgi:biopolymer transport protein ExbD